MIKEPSFVESFTKMHVTTIMPLSVIDRYHGMQREHEATILRDTVRSTQGVLQLDEDENLGISMHT